MNTIWGIMMIGGMAYALATGRVEAVSEALLDSSKEAIELCITMFGVMAFWMGLMEIAKEAGLVRALSRKLHPLIRFLFPAIPQDHPAQAHITMNCAANLLGLGWAATPAGLKAMEALADLEEKRRKEKTAGAAAIGTASNEMCTFLILNISSLQLIPMNVIAYRSQYGSASPAAIIGPGIAATVISTLVAVLFCKVMDRPQKNRVKYR